ncbi:MAG TPA: hypothetical protein VEF89_02750 [Solirubrobacteraceae bacterium]|nr:hypothetical protein [Solirubrobacteraceae bacterium]
MPDTARNRGRRGPRRAATAALVTLAALITASNAWSTTVSFTTAPTLGNLSGVTLNGQAQTTTTTWNLTSNPFKITSSGTNNGWNLTVQGHAAAGSAVFKQYCPNTTCGTDTGPGYITGGYTLPANSLTINTASASWTTGGTTPTYQCNVTACNVDSASAVKIVSASTSVGLSAWQTSGSAALSLTTPTTLHILQTNEVYRVNLIWTVSTGP